LTEKEIIAMMKSRPAKWDWTTLELSRALGQDVNKVSGRVTEMKEKKILMLTMPRNCTVSGQVVNAFRLR